jgi:uncharacterized protein YkwD
MELMRCLGVLVRRGRKPGSFVSALLGAAALLPTSGAHADALAVINSLRAQGCAGAGTAAAVQRHRWLDEVAQELSRRPLPAAMERVGYPAAVSTSFHFGGSVDDAAIRRLLRERYCSDVGDARYTELGVFEKGTETWIVLAARQTTPALPNDPTAVAERVLELVNAARGGARRCGRDEFAAAPPLTLSAILTGVASLHARDMAQRGSLGHRGIDGSTSAERLTRSGYQWRASGENVAAGQREAQAVVTAWLDSPPHCASIMTPQFTEMGVAFALVPPDNPAIYWVQVFAAPQ